MPKGGVRENASRTPTAQPWKTDPNLRRFTVKQQERRQAAQALAERNSQSGFNVNPDYRTVHTDAFGPSTSGIIKKERAKKLAALDECVTKDWTTTQDNYGNYHQLASGRWEAKSQLAHRRSKIEYQTFRPWSTTYTELGQGSEAPVPRKKVNKKVEVYFPEDVEYQTCGGEFGGFSTEHVPDKQFFSKQYAKVKTMEVDMDIWKTSSDTYGGRQGKQYLPDRRAKSDNIAERLSVSNPAPVTDILGRVNTGKEEELFQNRVPPKLRSFVWNSFLSSDSSLPPPGYRGKAVPEFEAPVPGSLGFKLRQGMQKLGITYDDLYGNNRDDGTDCHR